MKTFKVTIKTYSKAVDKKNVQSWLDNFVLPDIKERWSDGNMHLEYEIEEDEY